MSKAESNGGTPLGRDFKGGTPLQVRGVGGDAPDAGSKDAVLAGVQGAGSPLAGQRPAVKAWLRRRRVSLLASHISM